LWAPHVSVKQAFKLERVFAIATRAGSSVPLLREFLHASARLKVTWSEDPRIEELFSLSPENVADRFAALVRETQHALATEPMHVAVEKPLDAILLSEALRRNRAPTRLSTIDILELHQFSQSRNKVAALPDYVTPGSTVLSIRRKQRESLRGESQFLKLFEFCDHVATDFHYHPQKDSPEISGLKDSLGVALLKTVETRHFSIKNHKVDSETFVAARDNTIYANHLLEALCDAVNGASGEVTWASHPDNKRHIWEQLNFDMLLKEVDASFVEYQALPETKNRRIIEFVPTRGILMEFAGDICGTCVSRLNFISENASEGFFVSFVRGGKVNEAREASKRLEGGAFVFRGMLADGRPTFVIRGFNPSHGLINEVAVGELFERLADYLANMGAQGGVPTVSIPDDAFWGNAMTNRRYAFLYLHKNYEKSEPIGLLPSQVSNFNNCPVSNVRVVRDLGSV
jgi:hypothetical protein